MVVVKVGGRGGRRFVRNSQSTVHAQSLCVGAGAVCKHFCGIWPCCADLVYQCFAPETLDVAALPRCFGALRCGVRLANISLLCAQNSLFGDFPKNRKRLRKLRKYRR